MAGPTRENQNAKGPSASNEPSGPHRPDGSEEEDRSELSPREQQLREQRLKALGAAVRRRRKDLELSQEEVAEAAELHRTYVGGVERGERNVTFLNAVKIAGALELSLQELVKRYEAELQLIEEFGE